MGREWLSGRIFASIDSVGKGLHLLGGEGGNGEQDLAERRAFRSPNGPRRRRERPAALDHSDHAYAGMVTDFHGFRCS